jgi:hypothetical protein
MRGPGIRRPPASPLRDDGALSARDEIVCASRSKSGRVAGPSPARRNFLGSLHAADLGRPLDPRDEAAAARALRAAPARGGRLEGREVRGYVEYNRQGRDCFAGRADFLALDPTAGLGWGPPCDFLRVPVPNVPFPQRNRQRYDASDHARRRKEPLRKVVRRLRDGLAALAR